MKTVLIVLSTVLLCAGPAAWAAVFTETFDSMAPGALPSTAWSAGGPLVVAGAGVNSTNGLGVSGNIFNWLGQPFSWVNDVPLNWTVRVAMDFETEASGSWMLDDDRVGWNKTSGTSSSEQFAVQVDNPDGGLVTYWRTAGGGQVKQLLNPLTGIQFDTWYRLTVDFTKLSNSSAKLDALVTELDASGNPTANTWAGSIADTSTMVGYGGAANAPNPAYFSTAVLYPTYKNYTGAANVDNAAFGIVPEPASLSLLLLGGLALIRRRRG